MNVAAILADPVYPQLKQYVLDHTGLGYFADRDEDFAARLGRRLSAAGLRECRPYFDLLRDGAAGRLEMDALVGELTIGETYFFRQREHFDFLRDSVFPDLIAGKHAARVLRVWSAGCATGAEPYSVSLLLHRQFGHQLQGWDVGIVGTDINVEFLARAREAKFDDWAFRETPPDLRAKCFRLEGKQWVLLPEYRRGVSFRYHNLAGEALPEDAPFDVILCRNVMIYFGPAQAASAASLLHRALADHGTLLVGHAEFNPAVFHQFQTVLAHGTTAYRKPARELPPPEPTRAPTVVRPAPSLIPDPDRPAPARERLPEPAPALDDIRSHADRGDWEEAAAECAELIRQDPLNAAAHFTLGLVFEHAGRPAEAEASLRRAIYLDRRFIMAHYHLGVRLQRTGAAPQARKSFANTLNLLAGLPDDEIVPHGDGIRAEELRDLARMHLQVLGDQ